MPSVKRNQARNNNEWEVQDFNRNNKILLK